MRTFTEYSMINQKNSLITQIASKINFNLRILGLEGSIWVAGFVYLAFFINPGETHFTICPLAHLGINYCPGCGLGNSISYIFRGEIINSITTHPLGLFAILVLLIRIISLIKKNGRKHA